MLAICKVKLCNTLTIFRDNQIVAREHLYVVVYDISNNKRWRLIYNLMKAYGHWLQLSVFQCRLTARRRAELARHLEAMMKPSEDHILILDMGPADRVTPKVQSMGRPYEAPSRQAIIV